MNNTLRKSDGVYDVTARAYKYQTAGHLSIEFVCDPLKVPALVKKIGNIIEQGVFLDREKFLANQRIFGINENLGASKPESRAAYTAWHFSSYGGVYPYETICAFNNTLDFETIKNVHASLEYKQAGIIGVGPLMELPDFKPSPKFTQTTKELSTEANRTFNL